MQREIAAVVPVRGRTHQEIYLVQKEFVRGDPPRFVARGGQFLAIGTEMQTGESLEAAAWRAIREKTTNTRHGQPLVRSHRNWCRGPDEVININYFLLATESITLQTGKGYLQGMWKTPKEWLSYLTGTTHTEAFGRQMRYLQEKHHITYPIGLYTTSTEAFLRESVRNQKRRLR